MKKNEVMALLSWLVPLLCIVFAGAMTYWQYRRWTSAQTTMQDTQTHITAMEQALAQSEASKGSSKVPAVTSTRFEDSTFVNRLRVLTQQDEVRLIKWASTAPASTAPAASETEKDTKAAAVQQLASSLEVAGPYARVRMFLDDLLGGPRLICLRDVKWNREEGAAQTHLSCTVVRFVIPIGGAAPAPGAQEQGGVR